MSYHYMYNYTPKPYYARRRSYVVNGETLDTLTTRYTWQRAMRKCEGPRGGKAYKPFYRNVYYAGGVFYKACNVQGADGKYFNSLEPITGTITEIPISNRQSKKNAPIPEASIVLEEGRPVRVLLEGVPCEVMAYWPMFAQLLGLEDLEAVAAA